MPVVKGRKTDKEKFSGAEATYTVECMMHDKKALQAGTSHSSSGTALPPPLTSPSPARTTSPTTPSRPPGACPPADRRRHYDPRRQQRSGPAPPHRPHPGSITIPVAQHKEGVLEANEAVMNRLKAAGIRVKMDASEQSAGWKFAEYEMKGVPLRLEMGPEDMEKNHACRPAGTTARRRASSPWTTSRRPSRPCWTRCSRVSSTRPRRTWRTTPTPALP